MGTIVRAIVVVDVDVDVDVDAHRPSVRTTPFSPDLSNVSIFCYCCCCCCSDPIKRNRHADDVCFYVGASCWEELQLESEIERGYWLPCKGPPEIALDGKCQHDMTVPVDPLLAGPKDDLWLSMMCAMGDDEANLAHMVQDDDQYDLSGACDNF